MFNFANPFLGIGALALILIAGFIHRILNRKKLFSSAKLSYSQTNTAKIILTSLLGGRPKNRATGFLAALRLAALLALATALARPQKVTSSELEPILGVDIMLVMDTSSSMQAMDFDPLNRMEASKRIASDFVAKRKGDRVGIVAFGGAAILACPPTLDHDAVQAFLNQVDIGMTQVDGTAIGSALMTALAHLKKLPSKSKTIILLTDGRSNAGTIDPLTAAKTAQAMGIKIYAVGTGKRGGGIFPVQDAFGHTQYAKIPGEEIDEETLTRVAETTQGKYFRATELSELKQIFEEIDRLEKTEVLPPKILEFDELYPSFVVFGLFLLGVEVLLRGTLFFTIP